MWVYASQLKAIQSPNRAGCASTQVAKGFQHCEWGTGTLNTLAQLSDSFFLDVAKQRASLSQVLDFFREQAHDAGACCVHCNWIVAAHDHAARFWLALDWSIPFHADDAVYYCEVRPHGSVDIENRAIDSCPVKDILRPTVASAWNDAKHIFERQRYAGPVMCLELGE